MDLAAIEIFLRTPYNMVVDAKMLFFFLSPGRITIMVMVFLLILSFFSKNFWCRYLCPYGALLGILTLISPTRVERTAEKCINCRKCENICPGAIEITAKKSIRVPECVGCLECLAVCPVTDCLSLTIAPRRRVPAILLPVLILTIFLVYGLRPWAPATGAARYRCRR